MLASISRGNVYRMNNRITMKKQKNIKIRLLIWASLLTMTIVLGTFNWMLARHIKSEREAVVMQQSNSLQGQANIPALEIQQGRQLRLLELNRRLPVNQRNRVVLLALFPTLAVLTIQAFRRLRKAQREINPHSLIDEIGNKP